MARIAIVGGHGQVARRLHPLLVQAGHVPVALVRNPAYAEDLRAVGAEVRLLDLEQDDVDAYARAFEGCDAVVFAAGGGPDGDIERKRTVDLGASVRSQEAAAQAGIGRFVQISAINVDAPLPDDTDEVWRAYVEAKRDADAALRASELAWTIVRPGRLTDDPGTGRVRAAERVERADITRDDVAAVVAAVLDDDRTVGVQFEVVGGEDAVPAAIAGLAS